MKRDCIIKFKVSAKEKSSSIKKSELANMNHSEFLRTIISGVIVHQKDKEYQQKCLYLLSTIGNNINQIAKRCNIKKKIDLNTIEQLKDIKVFLLSLEIEKR